MSVSDCWFTPAEEAKALRKWYEQVAEEYGISKPDTVVDPSAGNGDILAAWSDYPVRGFDIRPGAQHPAVVVKDWFTVGKVFTKNTLFIGNPPYSIMGDFLSHTYDLAEGDSAVCMLLPTRFLSGAKYAKIADKAAAIKFLKYRPRFYSPYNAGTSGANENFMYVCWYRPYEGNMKVFK